MFCVSCSSDAECASITDDGDFCNLSNCRCVDCISDAQCDPDRPRCDSTHGSCVECLTSADCSGADYCDQDRLKCL